jgi:alkyldihydroxyacetonephosphate synthase
MGFSREREEELLQALGRRLDRGLERGPEPVPLEQVRIAPVKLSQELLSALHAACGRDGVRTSPFERVSHSLGKSLPDLLRLRRGDLPAAPDAVVYPPDEGAVAALLRVAAEANLAVIPVGGGSSVVGGIEPRPQEGQGGVLALDTTRLDGLLHLDPVSGTASFQAGIDGPALEGALRERGFTLGHFPQSFEHSTLGGWIAARSTGQQSDRYGGIEDLVVALRVVTPEGVLRTLEVPRSAAGPDLNALVLGSEGTLGVIVQATLRVRPAPEASDARGLLFRRFEDGVAAAREIVQEEIPLALLRLSDAEETRLGEVLRRDPARRWDPAGFVLGVAARFGYAAERCLVLYGAEGGDSRRVRQSLGRARSIARRHGALPLGSAPGRSWRRERFRTPYLRDWLLDFGVAVDTLETAVPWSRVESAHADITRALRASLEQHAGAGLAMTHLSHSYPDGACLYFIVLYPLDPANDLAQWQAIKHDATQAVVASGGTLSHHHGIGIDHAAWLAEEKGAVGMAALRAVKAAVDTKGIMNPGKLT